MLLMTAILEATACKNIILVPSFEKFASVLNTAFDKFVTLWFIF